MGEAPTHPSLAGSKIIEKLSSSAVCRKVLRIAFFLHLLAFLELLVFSAWNNVKKFKEVSIFWICFQVKTRDFPTILALFLALRPSTIPKIFLAPSLLTLDGGVRPTPHLHVGGVRPPGLLMHSWQSRTLEGKGVNAEKEDNVSPKRWKL